MSWTHRRTNPNYRKTWFKKKKNIKIKKAKNQGCPYPMGLKTGKIIIIIM